MKIMKKLICIIIIILTVSSTLTLYVSAADTLAYGAATVGAQGLRMRAGPDSTYRKVNELKEGDIVVILDRSNSEWYKINFNGSVGYVNASLLRDILTVESFYAKGYTTAERVNIRDKPKVSGEVKGTYVKYTEMTITGIDNGWYRVKYDGITGYVRSDLMRISAVNKPAASKAKTPNGSPALGIPADPTIDPNEELGLQVAEYATNFVGFPYVFGSQGPSAFDCSGLVYYVYRKFGYKLSRTAGAQNTDKNGVVFYNRDELFPGDLVFFSKYENSTITHIGIYIGDFEFVHASRPGVGIIISRIDSAYYKKVWHSGKRLYSPET